MYLLNTNYNAQRYVVMKSRTTSIMQLKSFQNIMTELPREELNLLVIFWCTNEKSLLWNISFLFSIARFGGIVYCCPSCLEIFRAAQCWNAPETPSDEDSIVIFWNLISALFGEFSKTWSFRSNSVTRQVNFHWTKIGEKCQSKIQIRHFWLFSNTGFFTCFF